MGFLDRVVDFGGDVWDELTDVSGKYPVSPDLSYQSRMEAQERRNQLGVINALIQHLMNQPVNPNHVGPQFNPMVRLNPRQVQDMRLPNYYPAPSPFLRTQFEDLSWTQQDPAMRNY